MSGEEVGIQRLNVVHIQRDTTDNYESPNQGVDGVYRELEGPHNAQTGGQLLTQIHGIQQTIVERYEYQLSVLESLREQSQDIAEIHSAEVSAADAKWLQSEIEAMTVDYDAQRDELAEVETAIEELVTGDFIISENEVQNLEQQRQVANGEFQAMQNRWLDIQNELEAQNELEME